MKISLLPVACLAVFTLSASDPSSVAADAPAASVAGRYEIPGEKDSYFEFRPDGTCIKSLLGEKHTVNYTVNGNAVTLTSPPPAPATSQEKPWWKVF